MRSRRLSFLPTVLTCSRRGPITAVVLCLLALGVPAVASAELTKGSATDPIGDSVGAPSQDFVSATAQYDSNGSLTVTATMSAPIASGPASLFSFGVASFAPPESCTGVTASLFGFSTSKTGTSSLTGLSGSGTASITVSGNRITLTAAGTQFANKSFSCMTASVAPKRESHRILDQLNPPLWFEGFGPPESTVPVAPRVSLFGSVARVKRSTGIGSIAAGCDLPVSENCGFALTLYSTVTHGRATRAARVKVGTVTGTVHGERSGKLRVRLNAAGRRYLRRRPFHAEAKGRVKSTAGLVTQFHRRIRIKA
jgi:hypothetical protein